LLFLLCRQQARKKRHFGFGVEDFLFAVLENCWADDGWNAIGARRGKGLAANKLIL
jgi:hypothetical protein